MYVQCTCACSTVVCASLLLLSFLTTLSDVGFHICYVCMWVICTVVVYIHHRQVITWLDVAWLNVGSQFHIFQI